MAGHQVSDGAKAIEYAYEQGWSDGLPVVPPTPDRIGRMLDAFSYPSDEEIGRVVERERVITAGHVAANAVMAGCTDNLFPLVLAAVEAILDPRFNVVGPTASTGGSAPLVIVHGPVVTELRFNSGSSVLGSGNRSNLTLGRALNLVVRNGNYIRTSRRARRHRRSLGLGIKRTLTVSSKAPAISSMLGVEPSCF